MSSAFNHSLVPLGRQLRQMKQEELARLSRITQGHLSKIENGLTDPSEDVLGKISTALDLPEDFFRQTDRALYELFS